MTKASSPPSSLLHTAALRRLAIGFFVLALVLLGASVLCWHWCAGPELPFFVEESELDLGTVAPAPQEVVFRITNRAARPRRVIGVPDG